MAEEVITTEELQPAQPSDITPEQIQGEQDRIAEDFGEHNITKIGAEGNLAGQEPVVLTTDSVKKDVQSDSDQLDVLSTGNGISKEDGMLKWGTDWTGVNQVGTDADGNPLYGEGETQYDSNGNALDRFGNVIGEPTDQEAADAAYADMSPAEKQIYDAAKEWEAEEEAYQAELDAFGEKADAHTQQLIANIKKQFAARKAQMAIINKNILGSQKLLGARSGRQRYASELQSSILGEEERKGIARLAELDTQMNSLILQAEMARTEKNYALLGQKIALATQAYNQKRQAIMDLATLASQRDEALAAKAKQSFEENKYFQEEKDKLIKYDAFNLLSLTEDGVNLPDNAELEAYAELHGYDTGQFVYEAKQAALALDKLSQEDQKSTLEIMKLQQDMAMAGMNEDQKAYQFAINNMGEERGFYEWLQAEELARTNPLDTINKQLQNLILEKELGDTEGGDFDIQKINGEDYFVYENGTVVKASDILPKNVNPQAVQDGKRAIEDINYLINHGSLDMGVGPNAMARKRKFWFQGIEHSIDYFTGGTADFVASTQQLMDTLSLDKLIAAKSKGATFGALSDTEMDILRSSATKIGNWRILDKNEKVIGYEISEKLFKAELEKIQYYANLDLKRKMRINY